MKSCAGVTRGFLLFIALGSAVALTRAAPQHGYPDRPSVRYRITDLGPASDWQYSFNGIHCLNNRGQIIAQSDVGHKDGYGDLSNDHTFVWDAGHWHDIGELPPYHSVEGMALNDRDQVVGAFVGPETPDPPSPTEGLGFVEEGNTFRCLPQLPPDTDSEPAAINSSGEVVGSVFQPYIPSPDENEAAPTRAFLYRRGRMTALAGDGSDAVDINDRGQIVGNDNNHVFLWQSGRSTDLGRIGRPVAINARGQVLLERGDEHGRLWQDGEVRDIGALPGLPFITVKALNAAGEIVGQASAVGVDHAFLWENGRMHDLSHITREWTLTEADGINDRGQIVGVGTYRGDEHDFLLTPYRTRQ